MRKRYIQILIKGLKSNPGSQIMASMLKLSEILGSFRQFNTTTWVISKLIQRDRTERGENTICVWRARWQRSFPLREQEAPWLANALRSLDRWRSAKRGGRGGEISILGIKGNTERTTKTPNAQHPNTTCARITYKHGIANMVYTHARAHNPQSIFLTSSGHWKVRKIKLRERQKEIEAESW